MWSGNGCGVNLNMLEYERYQVCVLWSFLVGKLHNSTSFRSNSRIMVGLLNISCDSNWMLEVQAEGSGFMDEHQKDSHVDTLNSTWHFPLNIVIYRHNDIVTYSHTLILTYWYTNILTYWHYSTIQYSTVKYTTITFSRVHTYIYSYIPIHTHIYPYIPIYTHTYPE